MSLSFCHSLGLICLNFTACGICGIRPTLDHQCMGLEERQGPGHCEGTFRQGKGQQREGPWSSVLNYNKHQQINLLWLLYCLLE